MEVPEAEPSAIYQENVMDVVRTDDIVMDEPSANANETVNNVGLASTSTLSVAPPPPHSSATL